jgi:hypothetical protein
MAAVNLRAMLNITKQNILWVDCIGGLFVGVLVLCLCRLISSWGGLPIRIVAMVGFANLFYGTYSLWLTTRTPRPMVFLQILALANMAWLLVCISIVVSHWSEITILGITHKLTEGIYVAGLGYMEWQWREKLAE